MAGWWGAPAAAQLHSGRHAGTLAEITGSEPGAAFGHDACAITDISGDGVRDLVIAAPGNAGSPIRRGHVYFIASDISPITILQHLPGSEVTDAEARERLAATGLPWRIRHVSSGVEFLLVPPGAYMRGAGHDDPYDRANERPQHRVTISEPFYLSRYEITNAQMRRFDPTFSSGDWYRNETYTLDEDDMPAVDLTWNDAVAYAEHHGFKLPTEAQWEYAARASVLTRYPWGNDISKGEGAANLFDAATPRHFPDMDWESFPFEDAHPVSAPVGSYPPNAWGFHDMTGNVWEWCADAFSDDAYDACADGVSDPVAQDGDRRTLRGGGFGNAPRGSGLPYRFGMAPDDTHDANGFRVLMPASNLDQ